MCNLYSITRGQAAITALARAVRDVTGNLPPMPGVFPDYFAPIVHGAVDDVRELSMARWGMPSPAFALKGRTTDPGVTNIRNVKSPHWRRWLGPGCRCVVPFITCDLFGFFTCEPNAEVAAVLPKAMPVILTTDDEIDLEQPGSAGNFCSSCGTRQPSWKVLFHTWNLRFSVDGRSLTLHAASRWYQTTSRNSRLRRINVGFQDPLLSSGGLFHLVDQHGRST